MLFCKLIEAGGIRFQKDRHLIDKRSGSACARSVHPLLDGVFKINDFGVFSAELDHHGRFRNQTLHRLGRSDDFLHEWQIQPFCNEHSARAGNIYGRFASLVL